MIRGATRLGLFWVAQFISTVGDHLFWTSLIFLVLSIETSHSSLKAGFVSFSETLPYLLFGVFSGVIVDRLRKKKVLLGSTLFSAFLLFSIPLFHRFGLLNYLSIALLSFILSTSASFFFPARDAAIPMISEGRTLLRVNAFIQSSTQIAMVIGTLLAGILLTIGRGSPVNKILTLFVLDGVTFLVAFILILLIAIPEEKVQRTPFLKDISEGLKYVFQDSLLKGLLILTALDNFFIMGPAVVGANLLVKKFFNLEAQYLAYFYVFLSAGWLLGTIIISRLPSNISKGKLLIFGIFMDGATYIPLLYIKSYLPALIIIFIHGMFISCITVPRTTLIQEYVPESYRGRVFALIQLTVLGFMALSSFTTGALGEFLLAPSLFFIGGLGGALSGVLSFIFFSKLRNQK